MPPVDLPATKLTENIPHPFDVACIAVGSMTSGLGEEGHDTLGFSEEFLEVFVGGFAPEVAVFVAERVCFGYGGDLRQVLFEI